MPNRLMLAAEIMLEVAHTMNDANRALLEAAAAELAERAREMSAELGIPLVAAPSIEWVSADHDHDQPYEMPLARVLH